MTIKAGQASPRPVTLSGVKAPEVTPDQQVSRPKAAEPKGDRLAFVSPGAQSGVATPSLGEVVAKVTTAKAAASFQWLKDQPLVAILNSPFGQGEAPQDSSPNGAEVLSGRPTAVRTTSGARVEVTLTKVGDLAGVADIYQLTAGADKATVMVARGLDTTVLLPKAAEYYADLPERHRHLLKTLMLDLATNPEDALWRKVYSSNHISAASAGDGQITFWQLKERPDHLSKRTFIHEMGHLVGQGLSNDQAALADHVPPGWEEAAKLDGHKVSDYAGMSPNEDFAETWEVYAENHDNPYTMASLREEIPHRLKLIEAIVAKEGAPAPQEPRS